MSWIENILIITGISMDIFASMECQGSLIAKVNKKQLIGICGAVAGIQMAAFFLGHFLVQLYFTHNIVDHGKVLGQLLALIIFVGIGVHLLMKAVRNERVVEHLESQIPLRSVMHRLAVTSVYTILAGIAFGFLVSNVRDLLFMVVLLSAVFIIAGIYTGYHFGFEQKNKAYYIGAALLFLAGGDVLIRLVTEL